MRLSTPELRPWLLRTVLWALILGVLWYALSGFYERSLGSVAARFLAPDTFLVIQGDTFFIGFGPPQQPVGPLLQFSSQNFGFGLVLAGAVALGAPERSWLARAAGLLTIWMVLFLGQVWVLAQAAGLEAAAVQGHLNPTLGRLILWSFHGIVAVLPGALAVAWLLLPLGMRRLSERRALAAGARRRSKGKRR